jgi:two-component system phosphate regulon response regulator PhoB
MSSSVKTILIADDDEDLRLLVQVTLENPTYRILTAVNGRKALEAVNQHRPDLLIIDWMMPGLNGCEAVARLRENPETASIPVVMLTARDGFEGKEETASLALAGYLAKPFSPLELIKKVREVLET